MWNVPFKVSHLESSGANRPWRADDGKISQTPKFPELPQFPMNQEEDEAGGSYRGLDCQPLGLKGLKIGLDQRGSS